MRLIDADKLKEDVIDLPNCPNEFSDTYDKARILDLVDEQPIADVEPVKHGHWTSSQGLAEVGEVQCSNCKTIYYADDLYNVGETDESGIGQALMPYYCPHCGAYMGVEDVRESD